MKNFFVVLFILFTFFFSANQSIINAQPTGSPSPQNIFNTTSNCGGVNQACCNLNEPTVLNLGIQGLPFPFDVIVSPFNAAISFIGNTVVGSIDAIKQFFINTFDMNDNFCKESAVPSSLTNASCTCLDRNVEDISRLCLMTSANEQSSCLSCVTGKKGIWTAVGCIESDLSSFIRDTLLGWGIGLAGILSLLCTIYAAFQMQTSQANPEKIKKAQEMLTSCITGLVLIIFSVFILRLIGVDILRIPGFG